MMTSIRATIVLVALATLANADDLRLTLPPIVYATPGVESAIYFDNIVLTQMPETYRFQVDSDLGAQTQKRWALTPLAENRGDHAMTIKVLDAEGQMLDSAKTIVRVAAEDANAEQTLRLLIVGDSLTHASVYPNELARLFREHSASKLKLLGTHQPKRAEEGVVHEGYGGWTWRGFVAKYEPNPDGTYRKRSSPFVYLNDAGKPALDVSRYINEQCDGDPPDVVTFLLGINDCFSADSDDPKAVDERISGMFEYADTLLAAFVKAAPNTKLAICLTTPPNSRQAAFEANYKDRYTRWGWKRIQHQIVWRQLEHFANREGKRIFIVPTELNLDPFDGYPINNGVHPNTAGYHQVAASIFAWLKSEAVR